MKAWYRQFWPWALMVPPLAAVAGGVMMIVLATRTPSAMAVADYSHIEELTSARFDRDAEAARLGIAAQVRFEAGQVALSFDPPSAVAPADRFLLNLQHASDAARDLTLQLVRDGSVFVAPADIAPGRYRLELMPVDQRWRLASAYVQPTGAVALRPQDDGS